jgi:hypothetical protein
MIDLVNDLTINANLIQAATMFILYPLLKDEINQRGYEPLLRSEGFTNKRLTKRLLQLEARQTLLEADLALLHAQLEQEYSRST